MGNAAALGVVAAGGFALVFIVGSMMPEREPEFTQTIVPISGKIDNTFDFDRNREFLTGPNTIMCPSLFSLKQGVQAVIAMDNRWFDQLGCVRVKQGIKVFLILDPAVRPHRDYELPVRVTGKTTGVTAWVQAWDLTTLDGRKLK